MFSFLATDQDRTLMTSSTRELFDALYDYTPSITRGATINIVNCIRGISIGTVFLVTDYFVPFGYFGTVVIRAIISFGIASGVIAAIQVVTKSVSDQRNN
jgi:hypothetical protein